MAETRSKLRTFMDVEPPSGDYALIGEGVTELSVNYSAQTSSSQYIHQESANTTVTGYQPTVPVTAEMIKDDRVIQFVNGLRRRRVTGSDAETTIVNVDAFDGAGDVHWAERQKVSIQFDNYGGAASDPLQLGFTLNYLGDAEEGTFDVISKKFTPGASTY